MTEKDKNQALRSIFKGASIVFVGIVISKVMALAFRVLVGRTLGPTEYGIITLMMAVFSVATTFGYMGINKGVQRYASYYRGEDDKESMIGTVRSGYLMMLAPSLLVGFLMFVLSPWISLELLDEQRMIWPIRMAAVALPLWGLAKVSIATTNAFEQMQYKVYISKVWTNVSEVVLAFLLIYLGYNYIGAAFAYAFGLGSAAILGFYFVTKIFPEVFSKGKKADYNFSELWSHSWPLFAASIFGTITGHIDTFMIQVFEGAESVGFYQAAYPFAALLLIGNSMFSSIFLSRASYLKSTSEEDMVVTFRVVVKWITLVTTPIFFLLIAYPRSVLTLFGAEYFHVENVLRILATGFMLNAVIGPAKRVYQAVDRTKIVTVLSVLLAFVNAGLNLALIPVYGIMGAAVASTLSFGVIFLMKIYYIHKVIGTHPFRPSILKVIGAGTASIGLIYIISKLAFNVTPHWFLIPAFISFAVLYPLLVLYSGAFEQEDLNIVYAIEKKLPFDVSIAVKLIEKFVRTKK